MTERQPEERNGPVPEPSPTPDSDSHPAGRSHLWVVPPIPPPWTARLSARESEVLHRLAVGRSTNEIARDLGISVATVKSHLAQLFRKVGAQDRVQLVVAAYRSGFVRAD